MNVHTRDTEKYQGCPSININAFPFVSSKCTKVPLVESVDTAVSIFKYSIFGTIRKSDHVPLKQVLEYKVAFESERIDCVIYPLLTT